MTNDDLADVTISWPLRGQFLPGKEVCPEKTGVTGCMRCWLLVALSFITLREPELVSPSTVMAVAQRELRPGHPVRASLCALKTHLFAQ